MGSRDHHHLTDCANDRGGLLSKNYDFGYLKTVTSSSSATTTTTSPYDRLFTTTTVTPSDSVEKRNSPTKTPIIKLGYQSTSTADPLLKEGKPKSNGWLKDCTRTKPDSGGGSVSDRTSTPPPPQPTHSAGSNSPMPAGNEPLAQLLITLKEQNKSLIREIEDLRIKLEDAEGDLKLVRCQMRTMTKNMDTAESTRDRMIDETILSELEFYKEKVLLLERDLQSLLDEKEELIMTKDDLRLKNDRLNEHLVSLMRNLSGRTDSYDASLRHFDVDALYLENRYYKEKIKNEEEEKRLLLERLNKYKELMEDHKRNEDVSKKSYLNSDVLDCPAATFELPGGHAITARDIERMIASNSIHSMEVNKSNQHYLWNLLVAMFEGLQTKNMNLLHARKTNRLLGKRVEELEVQRHRYSKSPLRSQGAGDCPVLHSACLTVPHSSADQEKPTTPSTLTTKDTSTEDEDADNEEVSSTGGGISTPSTTRRSLSIEQHLQALQDDALNLTPSHLNFDSLHHAHHHHHLFDYKHDFDTTPTNTLFN